MSTKTKTGAKLVDSIKKSKTGTVASKTAERPAAKKTTAAKAKASASRSTSAASKTPSRASANSVQTNRFSHGRRVWPD